MGHAGKRGIPEPRFPGQAPRKKMNELKRFVSDCDGQDLVEYGLLVAVVALGCVAALTGFQNIIGNVWSMISNNLNATN